MKLPAKNQPAAKKLAAAKKTPARKAPAKKLDIKKLDTKKVAKLVPLLAAIAPAPPRAAVLDRLHATITERRTADPAHSHSARLLSRGISKVAQKFGEESVECLIEAVAGNKAELVAESADVLYHLLVMWVAAGVEPDAVWAELARREGVSGIAEKAARRPLGTTKIP